MTSSTVTKTSPSAEGELRIPAVEANLLPVEIVEARRGRLARRVAVTSLVVVTILTTAWYGQARYQTSEREEALRLTEAGAQRVRVAQQGFPDLIATRAESQAIQTRLSGLLAGDLQWSRLLFSVRTQAPQGIRVTGVVGALHDDTAAVEAAKARTPGAVIGKLTVTGSSSDRAGLATFVDRLGRVEGLTNPLLNSATVVEGTLQFSVQLDVTTEALASRFITEDK